MTGLVVALSNLRRWARRKTRNPVARIAPKMWWIIRLLTRILHITCAIASSIGYTLIKCSESSLPQSLLPVKAFWTQNQLWLLGLPLGLLALIPFLRNWLAKRKNDVDQDKRFKNLLSNALAHMRDFLIPSSLRPDPGYMHRLTLFRANRNETELQLIARSCESGSDSETRWKIDNVSAERCEGVAGMAWFADATVFIPEQDQPDLPNISEDCSDAEIADYARRTNVSEELARARRWHSRSYVATTIRRSDGRRWGVLVLDSHKTSGANRRVFSRVSFTPTILTDIIEAWRKS